jgi:hypothetical protein
VLTLETLPKIEAGATAFMQRRWEEGSGGRAASGWTFTLSIGLEAMQTVEQTTTFRLLIPNPRYLHVVQSPEWTCFSTIRLCWLPDAGVENMFFRDRVYPMLPIAALSL